MITVPGIWSDVVWSPRDGFIVVASGPSGTAAYAIAELQRADAEMQAWLATPDLQRGVMPRPPQPIWTEPTYLIGVRAVVEDDLVVAGQRATDDLACVLTDGRLIPTAVKVAAQNGVLVAVEDGQLAGYVQVSGTQYIRYVTGGHPQTLDIPIGPTSQGFADFDPDRGGLLWMDKVRIVIKDGVELVCAMQRKGCWVGQSAKGALDIVGVFQGHEFLAIKGAAGGPNPHVAANADGTAFCVAAPLPGERIGVVALPPFPPVPDAQPDPQPAPTPTPEPPAPPAPPTPPAPAPVPSPTPGATVKYLSIQRNKDTGAIMFESSDTINAHSLFQQSGCFFALRGIDIGFNEGIVWGVPCGGDADPLVMFNAVPAGRPGFDHMPLGETGRIVPQGNGQVAIQWPL